MSVSLIHAQDVFVENLVFTYYLPDIFFAIEGYFFFLEKFFVALDLFVRLRFPDF